MNPLEIIGRKYKENMDRLARLVRIGKAMVGDAGNFEGTNRCYACHTQPVHDTRLVTYVYLEKGIEIKEEYVFCSSCLEGITSSN